LIFSLVGLVLIAVGGLIFFIRRRSAALQAVSIGWPTVEGRIVDAKLDSYRDTDNNVNYSAKVRFTFQVNGTEFSSAKVSWGGRVTSQSPNQANAVLARYPEGAAVPVYYNPRKPAQAVLEPREQGGLKNLTWIMSIFLGLGAIFFAVGFFIQD
jgi:hypothetical protein